MGKKRENSKNYSQMVAVITALISLTFSVGTAQAVSVLNSCTTYCHGIPPLDGTRKANLHFGSRSSALSGNHRNHLPAAPATASCGICHTPVAATEFGHQNNIIKMANSLKGYSSATLRAKYDKGIFFNQTSIPNLTNARCSNVNCHFEKQTPVWGTSSAGTTCETCHGALISPLTPAHPKHVVALGNTITACNSCHNSYSGTAAYTHATSAGRALTVTVGAYTGSNNRYLPSQTGRVTGTCSLVVCHGSGTLLPWSGALWSTTDQCGKCHSSNAAGAITQAVPFYSTAYPVKVTANTNAKVGAHTAHLTATDSLANALVCTDCHGTVTLTLATHMNGATNFTWSTLATKSGALAPAYTAATGTCANVYCHGASMPGGDTTGTNRAPTWINPNYLPATISAAACGTCHGFPPSTTSGHPAVTIPAGFPATATIGTTCSCHANINTAGNSYANIFVNKALHIDGTLQVTGGHAVPYDTHNAAVLAAGGSTACLGCHALGTSASVYPAATVGNPPDCMSCHKKAAPLPSGTTAGAACSSCHGSSTAAASAKGRPNGSAFPDKVGQHSRSEHTGAACTICHTGLGTAGGTGSGVNHGRGSTTGPVRDGKPDVVGPGFATGITVTGAIKGVSPSISCNHSTISSGCSGGGSKTW